MRGTPCGLFGTMLTGTVGLILWTAGALPDTVATHFGAGGQANGWMTRDGYRVFMLAFGLGLPLFVTAAVGLFPRLSPRLTNLPNREHWLAPERRDASLRDLGDRGCWLGCLCAAFVGAIHLLLLRVNATVPPVLPTGPFLTMLVAFLAGLGVWMWRLHVRYRGV